MSETIVWTCNHCGYLITDTQYTYARFDYYCPRCKEQRYSSFEPTLLINEIEDDEDEWDNWWRK